MHSLSRVEVVCERDRDLNFWGCWQELEWNCQLEGCPKGDAVNASRRQGKPGNDKLMGQFLTQLEDLGSLSIKKEGVT